MTGHWERTVTDALTDRRHDVTSSVMTENHDEILSRLPARLKTARQTQGLSLEAVAKLSGVSRSMVSQIERGESSPTIATLWNLTRALQVDFAGLLEASPAPGIEVIRSTDIPTIDNHGQGCQIRILSAPETVGKHEVYELIFAAHGLLDSQPHRRGATEQITAIDGPLRIISGTEQSDIDPGDTARYAADVPHKIIALNGPARAFLVVLES